jgi:hypothetical protein
MKEFEPGLPAQVSSVITTTPLRMIKVMADHLKVPARLDLHESGIIGKPFKSTSTAIGF